MNKFMIEYRGKVRINSFINGVYSNTQVFHNVGTNALFTYLCRALATDRIDSGWAETLQSNRPHQLILQGSNDNTEWKEVSIAPILIYSAVQGEVTETSSSVPSITFNALLASQNVKKDTYKHFRLVMQNVGKIDLAIVALSSSEGEAESYEIAEDEIQQIQWTMSFVNVIKTEQTEGGND